MTEKEWLSHRGDPGYLLIFPTHRANARKLRLFACACAFRIQSSMRDERYRRTIEVGERYADGDTVADERMLALRDLHAAWQEEGPGTLSHKEHAIVAAKYTLADSPLVSFGAANRAAC